MSIEVRNVSKQFGSFQALDDVSLDVDSGSLTALLGPSGSGKSTLLRIIAGLEQPDIGEIRLAGEDATVVAPQKRGVGFVFQHYAAFKHMTVRDNVAFGLKIRKQPKEAIKARVDELLQLVQLQGFGHRYPAQLSGGQRQRMALARALAPEPKVLLLDEPFGALDARVRAELRVWLRKLHDETHTTTVFVTHDQEEAMEVADSVVVMNDGRVEQVAGPRELYDAPANEFVMTFVGEAIRFDGELVRPARPRDQPGRRARRRARRRSSGSCISVSRRACELTLDDGSRVAVQMTRGRAAELELEPGQIVLVRRPGVGVGGELHERGRVARRGRRPRGSPARARRAGSRGRRSTHRPAPPRSRRTRAGRSARRARSRAGRRRRGSHRRARPPRPDARASSRRPLHAATRRSRRFAGRRGCSRGSSTGCSAPSRSGRP